MEKAAYRKSSVSDSWSRWKLALAGYYRKMDYDKIKDRFNTECYLLWDNYTWLKILLSVVQLYVQSLLGRNLAFYRHRTITSYVDDPSEVKYHFLKDLGFEIFPDREGDPRLQRLSFLLMFLLNASVVGLCLLPYVLDQMRPGVCRLYSLNMLVRFLYVIAIGSFLRIFVYVPTSLPGSGLRCVGEAEEQDRPKTVSDIFLQHPADGYCGDLLFSGDALVVVTGICFMWHYLGKLASRNMRIFVTCVQGCLGVIQCATGLFLRIHYTADLTLGIIIGVGLWYTHCCAWRPEEPEPSVKTKHMSNLEYSRVSPPADSSEENSPNGVFEGDKTGENKLIEEFRFRQNIYEHRD